MITELLVDAFAVQSAVYAVPRADHQLHIEGVPPSIWKSIPYNRAGKNQEDLQDLAWQGLTFFPQYGTLWLLVRDTNIEESSCLLLLLLFSQEPPYYEALNWLQFAYTEYLLGV